MEFDIQRMRNLTTGRLHTEMGHIYEDLEAITGEKRLMTHMLPRAVRAIEPWLRAQIYDSRFWDGQYDITHTGVIEIDDPTKAEQAEMGKRYIAMPIPLIGKQVIGVMHRG